MTRVHVASRTSENERLIGIDVLILFSGTDQLHIQSILSKRKKKVDLQAITTSLVQNDSNSGLPSAGFVHHDRRNLVCGTDGVIIHCAMWQPLQLFMKG
jgi:hypothetical protein